MDYQITGELSGRCSFLLLSDLDKDLLCRMASDEEIRQDVFSMAPLKAPGVDGFQASFFQSHWDIVGPSVYRFVRDSLGGLPLDPNLNRTLLVLIPKIQNLERISQFRLISLCSALYKTLTKTIVYRMRDLMRRLTS